MNSQGNKRGWDKYDSSAAISAPKLSKLGRFGLKRSYTLCVAGCAGWAMVQFVGLLPCAIFLFRTRLLYVKRKIEKPVTLSRIFIGVSSLCLYYNTGKAVLQDGRFHKNQAVIL